LVPLHHETFTYALLFSCIYPVRYTCARFKVKSYFLMFPNPRLHVYGIEARPCICGKHATSAVTSCALHPSPNIYYPFESFRFLGNEELPYNSRSSEIYILYGSLNFSREITKPQGSRAIPIHQCIELVVETVSVQGQIAKV
jgi:hypothetical protein